MRLIIDSGSTKMAWILLDGNVVRQRFYTEGFNPNYSERQCLENIIHLVETRFIASPNCEISFSRRDKSASLQTIYYYGTGCGNEQNCRIIKEVFQNHFPKAEIHVTHDLMAACHALLGHESGIACILGTGSHSCVYDGENVVEKAISLGCLVGDEGSGMHIGREIVKAYFYGFMPEDLRHQFDQTYHLTLEEFLENVYHKSQPSRYLASFAKFAGENQSHPYVHELVKGCFTEFIKAFVYRYESCKSVKISFVGSVAYYFRGILEETVSGLGLKLGKVMATPAEGLVRFHKS